MADTFQYDGLASGLASGPERLLAPVRTNYYPIGRV